MPAQSRRPDSSPPNRAQYFNGKFLFPDNALLQGREKTPFFRFARADTPF